MSKLITTPWDPAEHLETDEDMAAYGVFGGRPR